VFLQKIIRGILTFKARIIARGDLQYYHTLQDTYAATLAARTLRTILAFAAVKDWEVKQFDIKQAFLNAIRRENLPGVVYELPNGFKKEGFIVLLDKALYRLRDFPIL